MSHQTYPPSTHSGITRRSLLASSAAGVGLAGLASLGLSGTAAAAGPAPKAVTTVSGKGLASHALCEAHHRELSRHLATILNSSYVEENMKNTLLRTTNCPHCKVAIAPDMLDRAAFSVLA